MNVVEWRQYYSGMVLRGGMRSAKRAEMVEKCGGKGVVTTPPRKDKDGKDIPFTASVRAETQEEAEERISGEILAELSQESLERKADQLVAELRR